MENLIPPQMSASHRPGSRARRGSRAHGLISNPLPSVPLRRVEWNRGYGGTQSPDLSLRDLSSSRLQRSAQRGEQPASGLPGASAPAKCESLGQVYTRPSREASWKPGKDT